MKSIRTLHQHLFFIEFKVVGELKKLLCFERIYYIMLLYGGVCLQKKENLFLKGIVSKKLS